jgi:hypothetical protein
MAPGFPREGVKEWMQLEGFISCYQNIELYNEKPILISLFLYLQPCFFWILIKRDEKRCNGSYLEAGSSLAD